MQGLQAVIRLRFCELEYTPEGAVTHWPDGTQWGALPHDKPHYHALAHRLGYEGDTLAYCREHELAHHLVTEGYHSHSLVIYALAHGDKPPDPIAASEEALAMALQRYARTNEHPFIDRCDWAALKARLLELTEEI